jgi:prepilin-type N-terminal cleavage/methylation domain-containing protein
MAVRQGGSTSATFRDTRGFTIAEVLVAMSILTVALLGIVGAAGLQQRGGIAADASVGTSALERGGAVSTAVFLAEERIGQLRRLAYIVGPPALDEIGQGTPPAAAPNEDYGTIAGYPNYRREVSVQNGVPGPNMKLITVTVRFRRGSQTGWVEESIVVRTIFAARA